MANEVVAVFRDERAARSASEAARAALGSGSSSAAPRVGAAGDEVAELRAEMREELQHTVVGPGNVGPFTKEMTKGVGVGVPVCTLIGAVVALPLAFVLPSASLGLVVRLVIAALVGAAAGATVGFMLGGFTAKGPGHPLAAERGVTVSIGVRTPDEIERVTAAMRNHDPIRIDLTTGDGDPVTTLTTEEEELRREK